MRETRGRGASALGRAILLALLPALMVLSGAHIAPSTHGSAHPVAQASPASALSTVLYGSDAHGSDHDHAQEGSDRHPHRDEPTCHLNGTHDQAGQTSRVERPDPGAVPVVLSVHCGNDVDPVLRPPPGGTHETAPARRDGGRRHLALAQISRI